MPKTFRCRNIFGSLSLVVAMGLSPGVQADNIDVLMSSLFQPQDMTYIGFDSVEREDIPVTANVDRKFLIVDFRTTTPQNREQELASVHRICTTLLQNRELIRQLTLEGYDMVSVAFDRRYQYDCL